MRLWTLQPFGTREDFLGNRLSNLHLISSAREGGLTNWSSLNMTLTQILAMREIHNLRVWARSWLSNEMGSDLLLLVLSFRRINTAFILWTTYDQYSTNAKNVSNGKKRKASRFWWIPNAPPANQLDH